MKSNYKRLGKYIREVNERDSDARVSMLLGVSIQKLFMPSIANTIGTDMSTYKIIRKNQFAYGPVTSRNGDKISVALLLDYEEAIISQAYTAFEVIDENELLPEYLMMWFRRPEFDRYARFKSHGSAREIFDWNEMCEVMLPVPHIDVQREIVREYKVLTNRIALNNRMIARLEETAQAVYKHWFEDFEFPDENGNPYQSSGGMMEFNYELEKGIPEGWEVKTLGELCHCKGGKRLPKGENLNKDKNGTPYIKVADMTSNKYLFLTDKFEYVADDIQRTISRYTVDENDLIISIVGTIGSVNVITRSLAGCNLTENCVKLTGLKEISVEYLYNYLTSYHGQKMIELKTVGGVQGKLPLYNINSLKILCPNGSVLDRFNETSRLFDIQLRARLQEGTALQSAIILLHAKLATINNNAYELQ